MISEFPSLYKTFLEENTTRFVPWHFFDESPGNLNVQFGLETRGTKEVLSFAYRQDQDTFSGFEIVDKIVTGKVIVFHLSFSENVTDWDIILSEHSNLDEFLKSVKVDAEEWDE